MHGGPAYDKVREHIFRATDEHNDNWWLTSRSRPPSVQWDFLMEVIPSAGQNVFGPQPPSAARQDLQKTRLALLKQRYLVREELSVHHLLPHDHPKLMNIGAELSRVQIMLKEEVLRASVENQNIVQMELNEAWRKRQQAEAWRSARVLTKRPIGIKRRRYDVFASCEPSAVEVQLHLAKSGPRGGCAAHLVDPAHEARVYDSAPYVEPSHEDFEEANDDFQRLLVHLRAAGCRRAVTEDHCPAELGSYIC